MTTGTRRPRWRRLLVLVVVALVVLAGAGWAGLVMSTSRSQLARSVVWGESDVDDHRRFPARTVGAGPGRFAFRRPAGGSRVPPPQVRRIGVLDGDRRVERDLEQFLAASDTTAFLIVKGDTLLYEGYFNGAGHDSVQTSMSIAKSVLSALVGIAIGEGRIASVDDPITRYVPELAERDRGSARSTSAILFSMTSSLSYEEAGTPWSDDTTTDDAPDLRALALRGTEVAEAPGRRFDLQQLQPAAGRARAGAGHGIPVATYLELKLWRLLGMQVDGSRSLDSGRSGFEKMESGANGRAAESARFGLLFARDGDWRGRQRCPGPGCGTRALAKTGFPRGPASSYRHSSWVQHNQCRLPCSPSRKYAQHLSAAPVTATWSWSASAGTTSYRHWPEAARRPGQAAGRASPNPDVLTLTAYGAAVSGAPPPGGGGGAPISPARARAGPGPVPASHQRRRRLWEATMEDDGGRRWLGGEAALGGRLLVLGTLVLVGQALELDMGRVGWPFFVIVPGLGLLGLGLAASGRLGEVLAMAGGVVTMAGLVLLVQNATDRFDTWAYAWALVVVAGAGTGRWLVGARAAAGTWRPAAGG